jgi:hypothetical protein
MKQQKFLARAGRFGAVFLDMFLAFPRFTWTEILQPAACQRDLYRVLMDETRRLFLLQGILPLLGRRNMVMAVIVLLAFVLGNQAALFGLQASVEGIAATLATFTLVPLMTSLHVVFGGLARWYVTAERALLRGEDRVWQHWGTSMWLLEGGPQIASAVLSSLSLALMSLITLIFLDPLLGNIQLFLLPQAPPLNLSMHVTPALLVLALVKAMTISFVVGAWFVFRVATATQLERDADSIVGRTTQPFIFIWLLAEIGFWWLDSL